MPIEPGQRLGAYEIAEAIGAGGMGEVYRAHDARLKRDVAIKVLPADVATDADRLARFRREAEVLAALNHPNIAQIYGLEEADATTALVMELVEGPTLADRIAQGPLPPNEAMAVAYQVIDALEAAHERQIVHRDLKPANIKLRPDGTVKVLDFGIAKAVETPTSASGPKTPSLTTPAMTQAGILLGTAAYMSPEQARGKPVDRRTDIWAFGCLLYEMLTGQPAFGGEDVPITLARVLAHGTDLESLPGTVSGAVRHTISLCLEKDPHRRIADIADVRLALQGRFESEDTRPAQGPAPASLGRRALTVTAAVAIAAAVTAIAASQLLSPRPAEVVRFVHRLPADQTLLSPNVPVLAIAPDGNAIAYAAGGQLYLRRFDELDARPIPGTSGQQPIVPVFSPDGEWILYASTSDGTLKRVAVDGGTPLPVLQGSPTLGWRWADDGTIYFVSNCRIERISPDGGEPELVTEHANYNCPEPHPLPGGQYLLYERRVASSPERSDIVVESLETGEMTALFPGKQPVFVEPGYLIYYDTTLGLMARAFDPDSFEYGGPAAFGVDVAFPIAAGAVHYRVSANGSLAYIRGEAAEAGGASMSYLDVDGTIEDLAVGPGEYAFPSVSPDGSQLALQIGATGSSDIFVYDLSGESEMRQLTFGGGNQQPVWSADGLWIAYASDREGRTRIFRQRADGSGVAEALVDLPAQGFHSMPGWAPDGRLVYVETKPTGESLWAVTVPGGTPELLVDERANLLGFSFSRDGGALAYASSTSGIFEIIAEPYPPDGSETRISEPGVNSIWPVWSRTGNRLIYQTGTAEIVSVEVTTPGFAVRSRRRLEISGSPTQRRVESMPDDDRLLIFAQAVAEIVGSAGSGTEIVVVDNWIEELKAEVPAR